MRHNTQLCRSFKSWLFRVPLRLPTCIRLCSGGTSERLRTSLKALLLLSHCLNPSAAAAWSAASALLESSEARSACWEG